VLITSKAGTWEQLIYYFKQRKRTHTSRQPEGAIIIYRHPVGENGLGLNRPCYHYQKSFKKCSISNDLDGTEDDILWVKQHDKSDTDSKEEGNDMYDDT